MAFEHYIYAGAKRLRCGYTTGSCAALAAKAAVTMLLGGEPVKEASIVTPAGVPVRVDVLNSSLEPGLAGCAVQKDAGDDPDSTDGLLICAQVRKTPALGVEITGGPGVGRVTKPGLEQPVGSYAINRVPRKMICNEVEAVCRQHGYTGGIAVTISVPEGERAAAKTFNAGLGIEGGISILGTTGIVEPKSLSALLDSIGLEIGQRAAFGERTLVLTPGNYGREFIKGSPTFAGTAPVSCSNYIGQALDFGARYGFEQVLVVGHIGKLVKLAGGIMDTHSRTADCRTELFCAHGAVCGISKNTASRLLAAATADACLDILQEAGILSPVLQSLGEAAGIHLERRAAGAYRVGALAFSNRHGILFRTPGADEIMSSMEDEQ